MDGDNIMMKRRFVTTHDANCIHAREQFSVVSYNILAQCHIWKNDFSYTNVEYSKPDYRHGVLMDQLAYLDGDIVCLQEANPLYYNAKLKPAMESLGYTAAGIQRRLKDMDEGVATFFKTKRFSLIDCSSMSLTDLVYKEIDEVNSVSEEIKTSAKMLMDCADVMLVTQLQLNDSKQTITVGNVHIWWDEMKYPDVKTFQVAVALKETITKAKLTGSHTMLCGDFNSIPGSPPYQLATTGSLPPSTIQDLERTKAMKTRNGQDSIVSYFQSCLTLPNGGLSSAYYQVLGHEPGLTDGEVNDALDYIFYDSSTLSVTGVLETTDASVFLKRGGILGPDLSSDHLSIKAVFGFKPPAGKL